MADVNMGSVFLLKRGQSAVWAQLNPVLRAGEPGYELDTQRLKIGNGTTTWNSLKYIGEGAIVSYPTKNDFPAVGSENIIYRATQDSALYQWDATQNKYTSLSGGSLEDIESIQGGDANGNH